MNGHKSMRQQMSSLRSQIVTKKRTELKEPAPNPMKWVKDGEDHINIWEHGRTDLGKFLAHSSPFGFKHKIFGNFNAMESFWHYIQSDEKDDRIRIMHGPTLRQFAKRLKMVRVVNFRAIVMDSNWQRIKQHRDKMQMIAESSLPFDCYYVSKETRLRVRPTFFKWLIMGFDEIRTAIKEGREPIFDFLLDKPNSDIYEFVLPQVLPEEIEEPIQPSKPKPEILSESQVATIIQNLEQSAVA